VEGLALGQAVIETSGLCKRFGARKAVDNLSLSVEPGQVYGFLGPNGSGKSTTIRMLLGLIRPTDGQARLLGYDIRRRLTGALRHVGAQVETPAFYGYMSGRRNLELLGALTGPISRQAIDDTLSRVRLLGREMDKVRTYSMGMKARLALAQALLPRPKLLILDEPTNGLDPQGMREVRELIRALAHHEGLTIFLSSHLLAEVEQVCDRVAVIAHGRLVAEGKVADLLRGGAVVRMKVGCDQPEAAAEVARGLEGVMAVEADDEGLTVDLRGELAAAVNAALVGAGIGVYHLAVEHRSLEEFFFSVVGEEVSL